MNESIKKKEQKPIALEPNSQIQIEYSSTGDTLQSIDSTLKRIEKILIDYKDNRTTLLDSEKLTEQITDEIDKRLAQRMLNIQR